MYTTWNQKLRIKVIICQTLTQGCKLNAQRQLLTFTNDIAHNIQMADTITGEGNTYTSSRAIEMVVIKTIPIGNHTGLDRVTDAEENGIDIDVHGADIEAQSVDIGTCGLDIEACGVDIRAYSIDIEAHGTDIGAYSTDSKAHGTDIKTHSTNIEAHSTDLKACGIDLEAYSTDVEAHTADTKRNGVLNINQIMIEDIIVKVQKDNSQGHKRTFIVTTTKVLQLASIDKDWVLAFKA